MIEETEPEIVLYDLACNKRMCFSPVVWRIRLMLNYKRVPYKSIFLEFPDIEPTLKQLGFSPPENMYPKRKYTVSSIPQLPTDTYLTDSAPISQFIESKYPDSPVLLTSHSGDQIESQARKFLGPLHRRSVLSREINILSPRSGEHFRRGVEDGLSHPLKQLLDVDKENQEWRDADQYLRAVGELMQTHQGEGPFILGARPSYTDFFIAGSLQSARVVDEGVFQRYMAYFGFRDVYEACLPYLKKNY